MGKKKKAPPEMAAAAENQTDIGIPVSRQVLKLDSGAEYEIVSQDGKYFYCGMTQFRKSNPHIISVMGERT